MSGTGGDGGRKVDWLLKVIHQQVAAVSYGFEGLKETSKQHNICWYCTWLASWSDEELAKRNSISYRHNRSDKGKKFIC